MARKKKKKSSTPGLRPIATVMVLALLGVGVFGYYLKVTPGAAVVPPEIRKPLTAESHQPAVRHTAVQQQDPVDKAPDEALRIPVLRGDKLSLSDVKVTPPEGVDARVFVMTKTFEALGVKEGRALDVHVKDGLAEFDINGAVLSHGYGTTEEGEVVRALQLGLGQFPEIDRFEMILDGQQVDSLGALDLSDPIPVLRSGDRAPSKPEPESPQP